MDKEINYVWTMRSSVLHILQGFSNKQLNEVPFGFHNNLIWHAAHIIASQQDFFYLQYGLPLKIKEEFYFDYRIGTRPSKPVLDSDISAIKKLLLSSVDQLRVDYKNGMFKNLGNVDETMTHFIFHEGMHMAYILSIRRLIIYGNIEAAKTTET